MTDAQHEANPTPSDQFVWHPEYRGRSFQAVEQNLVSEIRRDQQSYQLFLENAEKEEHDAFNSVRELEKRWSDYDFGWTEVPAETLAARIMEFERAREERQEMFSWKEWKMSGAQPTTAAPEVPLQTGDWREKLTDQQRRRLASSLSVAVILGMILLCFAIYAVIR